MAGDMLQGDSRIPLYQRLADVIRGAIMEGNFKPGDLMPGENEIATKHKVSVGTVRNALDGLVKDGILERFPGRGTFVCNPKFDDSLLHCFRLCKDSSEKSLPRIEVLEKEIKVAPADVARHLGIANGGELISIRRLRFLDESPVLIEDIWLPADIFSPMMRLPIAEVAKPLYLIYSEVCGKFVSNAMETLSSQKASSKDAKLLATDAELPLIVIERLAKDYKGKPLEFRQVRGKVDLFHYEIEVK